MVERLKKFRNKDIKYDIQGNISKAIDRLKELQKENPDYYIDVGTYDEYGDTYAYVQVEWEELETDKEFKERVDAAAKAKEYRRKQYETLKKEFDSK